MELNKKKMIETWADEKEKIREGRKITKAKIRCAGCGKWITNTDDLSDVQISITKRGTGVFFHTKCMNKVWERKIAT